MASGAVELKNRISQAVNMDLPGMLVFDYPTIKSIVGFLREIQPQDSASDVQDAISAVAKPSRRAAAPSKDVENLVMSAIRSIMGAEVPLGEPLAQAGLDSLAAVELKSEICRYVPAKCIFQLACSSQHCNLLLCCKEPYSQRYSEFIACE